MSGAEVPASLANGALWREFCDDLKRAGEQVLAADVTGWPAQTVEYFELLQTTQYLNHLRLFNTRPDLRDTNRLNLIELDTDKKSPTYQQWLVEDWHVADDCTGSSKQSECGKADVDDASRRQRTPRVSR